ncbi:hypothetical protein [Priestia megaterium]|uniref:hypothetical protein n=1 Tax=Priestia megaterium TaxID=1404 RepID=UPI0028564998|nr:hypothetical protein [Priestia megaterium]MDR7242943.1 hypothetical protein [Priestia megaterium]
MAGDKIQTNHFSGGQGRLDLYILGIRLFSFVFQQYGPDETQPKSQHLPHRNRVDC